MSMYNFHYDLDIDYDEAHDCNDYGCDSICRCGKITETRIKSVNASGMASTVTCSFKKTDKRKKDKVFLFCLERLCNQFTPDDFYIQVCGGYYGEEIGQVCLDSETLLMRFLALKTRTEWVEFTLTQEYGYVLEGLQGRKWTVSKINLTKIRVPQEYRKLNRSAIDAYLRELALDRTDCLSCLTDGDFKLVDGYHRYRASEEGNKKKIWCIHPWGGKC